MTPNLQVVAGLSPRKQGIPYPKTSIVLVAGTLAVLQAMGYQGNAAAAVGVYQLDANIVAIILALLSSLLPSIINAFLPALKPIVQPLLDFLKWLLEQLTPEQRKKMLEEQKKQIDDIFAQRDKVEAMYDLLVKLSAKIDAVEKKGGAA